MIHDASVTFSNDSSREIDKKVNLSKVTGWRLSAAINIYNHKVVTLICSCAPCYNGILIAKLFIKI